MCGGGGGGVGFGVRVEVIGEVKFLWKFEKKIFFCGGRVRPGGPFRGWGGGGGSKVWGRWVM